MNKKLYELEVYNTKIIVVTAAVGLVFPLLATWLMLYLAQTTNPLAFVIGNRPILFALLGVCNLVALKAIRVAKATLCAIGIAATAYCLVTILGLLRLMPGWDTTYFFALAVLNTLLSVVFVNFYKRVKIQRHIIYITVALVGLSLVLFIRAVFDQ